MRNILIIGATSAIAEATARRFAATGARFHLVGRNAEICSSQPVTPDQIAQGIVTAVDRGRNEVYLPWFWRWIMLIIIHIPESVFKRLKL